MTPPRRIAALSIEQMHRLTKARLLSYRKKVLSLENSPEESDYDPIEIEKLDKKYIWFKSDPRLGRLYEQTLIALMKA
jgi:hypothetical protein